MKSIVLLSELDANLFWRNNGSRNDRIRKIPP